MISVSKASPENQSNPETTVAAEKKQIRIAVSTAINGSLLIADAFCD